MNILEEIVAHKQKEIAQKKTLLSLLALQEAAAAREEDTPLFAPALQGPHGVISLIAEVKRRSPSGGIIRPNLDIASVVRAYAKAGARAVSVLIDEHYFGALPNDLETACQATALPILYKEFVVDEWQIYHAAAGGASAVLLIVSVLQTAKRLGHFLDVCQSVGLDALVEVHDAEEINVARDAGAKLIGINNRNLKTLETSIETTLNLAHLLPPGSFLVSESGIKTFRDIQKLQAAGVGAILVGESLLRQPDLVKAVEELLYVR